MNNKSGSKMDSKHNLIGIRMLVQVKYVAKPANRGFDASGIIRAGF